MICQNYKCKKEIPDGTKKCPHCEWKQKEKNKQQPTIALTVSMSQRQEDGSFKIYAYCVVRQADGKLIDNQQVAFHSDDLEEFVETTGKNQPGRADHTFFIPASRAGENATVMVYTQIGDKRYEAIKTIALPKEKEKPPQKKATDKNFFKTLKKYKEGGKK